MRLPLALIAIACLAGNAVAEPDSRDVERSLARSLQAVGDNRLDVALNEVDSLLKLNPNFKLAQLVRGDLLLARSRQLNDFGDAPDAPRELLQDLREEAQVRLQRVQQQQPIAVPRYLWQMNAQQRYAIVVDTSKSTLYLYENIDGEPRYVADYYISMGKKGTDKVVEGDQKTPLGVYFVNGYIPQQKLADLYGAGAYPISYPNEWDVRQGRSGHGIWLHGTPSNTYSRAPRASNGCVVLANNDLLQLGKDIKVGATPVIITSQMDWLDDTGRAERDALLGAIEQWRNDWESRNTDSYLAHYAPDFSTGKVARVAFAQQKQRVNAGKSWIKVKVDNLSIFPYPTQPDLVVVNFDQDYASNNLVNRMQKRQYWQKRDGRWQIIYEGSAS
ncbi:MAG: L,D-transpeptidase family protein [Sideroxyarcus sp.]|nr:L,D-transpeptidase family protein [Sideroxyarcus sp.]